EGLIVAQAGSIGLGAGNRIRLSFAQGFSLEVEESALNAVIENRHALRAEGGLIILSASAHDELLAGVINNTGVIEASAVSEQGGVIRLTAGTVTSVGTLDVSSTHHAGGRIAIDGGAVALGGELDADGIQGGDIRVRSSGTLSLADQVHARGTAGAGGSVAYLAEGRLLESGSSRTDVSGTAGGGRIGVAATQLLSSGHYVADGGSGAGGTIALAAAESLTLLSAQLLATGAQQGGSVRVGATQQALLNDSTFIDVSSAQGSGGQVALGSSGQTTWLGRIATTGADGGGDVRIAAGQELRRRDDLQIDGAAHTGLWAASTTTGTAQAASDWTYAAVIGAGYTGGDNLSLPLQPGDNFGTSVALNANATRMAVGSADDGLADDCNACGAVYLFSFSDSNFNGATLQGVIGDGYTGGKNVNVALDANDVFGSSVSLNAVGNRLAIGASGDDGFGDLDEDSGAAYLFSFGTATFGNAVHQATLGRRYTGGRNIDVSTLEAFDNFGSGVALNAIGDRLAVGAFGDDGAGNAVNGAGAVYLFTFATNTFSGGITQARLGAGYTGGKNVNVANLGDGDGFGSSVSLNALSDRLAVGAIFDDGAGDSAESAGAVYLFSFSNTNFTGGRQQAIIGSGYTGGKNIDVGNLDAVDLFGRGVALNARGDRLVVGASNDDGASDLVTDSGAVYAFRFSDRNFGGGTLLGIAGDGYSGGNDINVDLDPGDAFGRSVALNAFATRLAVGAVGDSGEGNETAPSSGAVYLFR
ncbi:MAG: conserved hypothetical rane protein, partial [Moraxellaceae bacterium]|nr:conserved hypothetical rane protein [Moraxellaceae bacterium]